MGMHEEQKPTVPSSEYDRVAWQLAAEQRSGGGLPIGQAFTTANAQAFKAVSGEGYCTTIYFFPDGDAEIRYEKSDAQMATLLAMRAFLVLRVITRDRGRPPLVKVLKSRYEPSEFIQDIVEAYLKED